MPVGLTLYSTSAPLACPPYARPDAMTARPQLPPCDSENWVGIKKTDFYSLIDKIYLSEDNMNVTNVREDMRSARTQRHASGESCESRDSTGHSPPPAEETYRQADPSRTAAEQEASHALLDMRMRERERSPERDHEDLPIDLSRSQSEATKSTMATSPVTATFAAAYRQTAALSLLTGIDATLGLQRIMQRNNETANVKSTVKAKISNKLNQDKLSKEPRLTPGKSESGKQYHSKPSLKLNCSTQNKPSKSGSNPKECWVRVNKNMVFSLVEDLAIASLGVEALEPHDRSDTPVSKSDKAYSEHDVSNKRNSESPLSDYNNAYNIYKNKTESKADQPTVYISDKETEIDVENVEQGSSDGERVVTAEAPQCPQYSTVNEHAAGDDRHMAPTSVCDKARHRKRSQTDNNVMAEKDASAAAGTRKRKRSTREPRADTLSHSQVSNSPPAPYVPDVSHEKPVTQDEVRAAQEMYTDRYVKQAMGLSEEMYLSAMPALVYNPALMRHLAEAARVEAAREKAPSPRLSQNPVTPVSIGGPSDTNKRSSGTDTENRSPRMSPSHAQQSVRSPARVSPQLSPQGHTPDSADMKTARESPKLGWVAVSKEDVHTIVDMIYSDVDYDHPGNNTKDKLRVGSARDQTQETSHESTSHGESSKRHTGSSGDALSLTPLPLPRAPVCDHDAISSDDVTRRPDNVPSRAPPPSLSPRSDCSVISDKNSPPGDALSSEGEGAYAHKDNSTPSHSCKGFKWKSTLLKRAREEGEEESHDRSPQSETASLDNEVDSPGSPSDGTSAKGTSKRSRRNKRKGIR